MEQTTESELGQQYEANVSALDDSLAYEEQKTGSKPRIGT